MYLMKLISSRLCDTSHPKYVEHFNPMLQNIIFSVIKTISLGPLYRIYDDKNIQYPP